VNEGKNAVRERAIQNNTRGNKKSLQTSPDKREAFVQKKGKGVRRREASIEIERLRSIPEILQAPE
jgi:hypothetical protein